VSIERAGEASNPVAISQTYRVEWQDTDASGHYHHSTVVRWVEAVQAAFYETVGVEGLFERIVPVHYTVDYRSRVWFGDAVETMLTVDTIGKASVTLTFSVTCGSRIVAEGRIINVHLPDGDGVAAWPDDVRAAFEKAQVT
jgi:acyl-CoA thioester hydrolase